MTQVHTLILGGGMSGLSCAYHLQSPYRLLERSDEPGGLSRSVKQAGYVFDHTGHLLHLRNPYTLELIPRLMGKNLVQHGRRAWIYSSGVYTPYPFQAKTFGLPHAVIKRCLQGFIDARLKDEAAPIGIESFKSWVLRTFGPGFAQTFFFPYNEKLWTVSADVLTAEWAAPFVPKPSIAEIVEGALSPQKKTFGYNATFYYPREGGIQSLAFAFAEGLKNLSLQTEATRIDLDKKEITTHTGEVIHYEHLVTSLPLQRFLDMTEALPPEIKKARSLMRWTSVYNINLGVKRPRLTDKHWIYFPEKKFSFYRVGFPMNFSDRMTPPGCSSLYLEMAYEPGHPPDDKETMRRFLRDLRVCGLLEKNDEIETTCILKIPVAYVIFDQNRTRVTNEALSYLESKGVHSIGRFGGWKYSYMEEAILEGKATAEKIDGTS